MKKRMLILLSYVLIVVFGTIAFCGSVFAQVQGIWKDDSTSSTHNFFIQQYAGGSALILYTTDPATVYAFHASMTEDGFESDSIDLEHRKRLSLTFQSEDQGTAVITDNTELDAAPLTIGIHRRFEAIRTAHSGIWKDPTGSFSAYVQDYDTGATLIVYTYDGGSFGVFLGNTSGMTFQATSMGLPSEFLTWTFTDADAARAVVSSLLSADEASEEESRTYSMLKLFQPETLDVDFQASPLQGAAPLQVQFTDVSSYNYDGVIWDFGDGNTSTERNPIHDYTEPGVYSVSMLGATGLVRSTLTFRERLIQVTAPQSFEISGCITGDAVGCAVSLDCSGLETVETDDDECYSVLVPSGWSGTITPSASGCLFEPSSLSFADVTSKLTDQDFQAIVPVLPQADFSAAGSVSGFAPLTVQFQDASTGDPETWNWNFGDTTDAQQTQSTLQHPPHTYTDPGTYSVGLTVSNDAGSDTLLRQGYVAVTEEAETELPAPTLVYPEPDAAVELPVALQWIAVSGAGGYQLEVCEDASCSQVILDEYCMLRAYSLTLDLSGDIYWRVQARSATETGPWSSTWKFSVEGDDPPENPTETVQLVSPEDDETLCGSFDLKWTAVTGAQSYKVQVYGDSALTQIWISRTREETYLTIGAASGGPFYWRVQVNFTDGSTGEWSDSRFFYGPGGCAGRVCD